MRHTTQQECTNTQYQHIQHVGKDGVNKSLECCRSISETEGHYQPFIRPIVGAESCFPLVSGCDLDEIVHVLYIYLGVDFGPAGGVQKVRDQGEWVVILFGNFIEALEVNTEPEGAVLPFYKKDQSNMGGSSGADKSGAEIFIYESLESRQLDWRQQVECSQRQGSAFFKVNLQIVVVMWWEFRGFCLAEYICVVMILQRNRG